MQENSKYIILILKLYFCFKYNIFGIFIFCFQLIFIKFYNIFIIFFKFVVFQVYKHGDLSGVHQTEEGVFIEVQNHEDDGGVR